MSAFSYSSTPSAAQGSYAMTTGNSAPAFLVWLFLVTQPAFIDALEGVTDPDGPFKLVFQDPKGSAISLEDLATLVNLTPESVRHILRVGYLKAPDRAAAKTAFTYASAQFESVVESVTPMYDPTECGRVGGLTLLAKSGAAVNPAS
ncbi:hypothetical protein SAMN05421770_10846 [Granulicella rosea]|uniref:Uncharacterized protein n=1 Tax=Granulicella rosea TaxID=474952 RepID=A0A239LWJ1_9BACT|nr:hypothetical protein [Granulicella rosea]SNT35027.1 hypothetical protein SAMN05421770_10846 [Granulicella rosea]